MQPLNENEKAVPISDGKKRKENESFEEYRKRLKKEAKELKEYLKGRVVQVGKNKIV